MNYDKPVERPEIGKFSGFDHLVYWVGNAKQAAAFYTTRFGFEYLAYRGLETGERQVASHVVKKNDVIFEFQSPYHADDQLGMNAHISRHGDGVRDVAFTVEDCAHTFEVAVKRGAKAVREVQKLSDENGEVVIATVQTYGDTTHTFVERKNYKGSFMPGYQKHLMKEPINDILESVEFQFVDHVVGNQAVGDMEPTASWYERVLDFHRFWSVDDKIIHTDYSSLNSVVMADFDESIKMPINEPANGKRKSQIQEYVDYYHGAGVQHIALNTQNIISVVTNLRKRGVEFLTVPDSYYDNLRKNLPKASIEVKENLDTLQELKILIDYDDKGYLLQLFTKPIEDRPTLFFEFIQRNNHAGFGAGNFRALFKAIEDEQEKRGNLTMT